MSYEILLCPLPACTWAYKPREIQPAPPALADAFGLGSATLTAMFRDQEMRATERALHDHLAKHTPEEWLPELMRARRAAAAAEAQLEAMLS